VENISDSESALASVVSAIPSSMIGFGSRLSGVTVVCRELATEVMSLNRMELWPVWLRLVAYQDLREHHKAIDDYTEAIRLRPDYPDALINRGVRYQELGEFLHAIDDFTEAIRLKPDDPDAFRHRGTCFREIGEEQKAIDDFTEASRLGTSNPVERSKQMSTYGAEWTPDQNRIIVEAYFSMLRKQQDEKPYTKSQINREVREQTGKTRGSVEWKFCNISYLLEEMGHPIVNGYKPARNAQRGSLYQEINRHLEIT